MSKSGNGPFGVAYSGGAVNSRPEASFKVFQDQVFSVAKRISFPASTYVDIIADPTACACGILALFPIAFKAAFAGPIEIDLFANPTFTPNAPLTTGNRDFTSLTEAEIIWYKDEAQTMVSATGTPLPFEFIILSDGTAAVASLGGESEEDLISNIDMTKTYLIRLTNTEASIAKGSFAANWFEIP